MFLLLDNNGQYIDYVVSIYIYYCFIIIELYIGMGPLGQLRGGRFYKINALFIIKCDVNNRNHTECKAWTNLKVITSKIKRKTWLEYNLNLGSRYKYKKIVLTEASAKAFASPPPERTYVWIMNIYVIKIRKAWNGWFWKLFLVLKKKYLENYL